MGWRVAPGRFMMPDRRWKPAWRFQPTKKREDAFRLLDAADPAEYTIIGRRGRGFTVQVRLGNAVGTAEDKSEARAIVHAISRAFGVEPNAREPRKTGADIE